MRKNKLVQITTVPGSLYKFLDGQLKFMSAHYEVLAVSSYGRLLEKVYKKEGVWVKSVEMKRQITLVKDVIALENASLSEKRETGVTNFAGQNIKHKRLTFVNV